MGQRQVELQAPVGVDELGAGRLGRGQRLQAGGGDHRLVVASAGEGQGHGADQQDDHCRRRG
jgi:hypothetical protein